MSSSSSEKESSSSSTAGSVIFDNIDLFRQYSLDADLMELYFDRGVFYYTVNLDGQTNESSSSSNASSSSSDEFAIEIRLRKRSFLSGSIPADLELFIYEEKIGEVPSEGIISFERTSSDLIRVLLNSEIRPNEELKFSFKLNIEHPEYSASRTLFEFKKNKNYQTTLVLSPKVDRNKGTRLGADYRQYLLDWISQFWSAWDAGQPPPQLAVPFPNSFVPFYPFAHAKWKLLSEVSSLNSVASLSNSITFVEGNEGLLAEKNFLGLSPNNWVCVSNSLYRFDGYPEGFAEAIETPKPPRTYKDPDVSFDCRSFAAVGAEFVRNQISEVCPGSTVQVMGIGTHYLVYVELQGQAPCCTGSFLYEPMNGATYKDAEEFCNDDPGYCEGFEKAPTLYEPGNENSDGDFGDPNWEDSAEELARMESSVCDCLTGDYEETSREFELKQICQSGQMQDWLVDNLSFTPDPNSPNKEPNLTAPQTVECKKCITVWEASWDCDSEVWNMLPSNQCVSDQEVPTNPNAWEDVENDPCSKKYRVIHEEACGSDLECIEKLASSEEQPENPSAPPAGCCGKWCVLDSHGSNTGDCSYGSKEGWDYEKSEGIAGPFTADEKCEESDCPKNCPPGYQKVPSPGASPFRSQETGTDTGTEADFTCEPDCNAPEFSCITGYCCEENPFLSTFDQKVFSCVPCEKNKTLRFEH
jgi:hypothetical protein